MYGRFLLFFYFMKNLFNTNGAISTVLFVNKQDASLQNKNKLLEFMSQNYCQYTQNP